jgi:hypothetical protein
VPDTAASSIVTDHPFDARLWWERCIHCGLSMAAHAHLTNSVRYGRAASLGALDHRCPACVQRDHDRVVDGVSLRAHSECPHAWGSYVDHDA